MSSVRSRKSLVIAALAGLVSLAGALVTKVAAADVEHTVMRGHTLEAIANRYHVSKKAIMDANHLRAGARLRVGEVLVIPGVTEKPGAGASNVSATGATGASAKGKADPHAKGPTTSYASRPKTPGVIKVTRVAMHEDYTVRITDRRGRQAPLAAKQFEKFMRSPNANATHPIDPRLIALVGLVSDHFGGRKIEVISGYRPYTPTQYTPHSNHNHGRAMDFRVVGVPNEVVRDFCRTLRNTGCGYYPNSVFVHMDVRDKSAYWIDYSKPGEAPHYNAPNVDADEGANDVHRESPSENTPPGAPSSDVPAPSMPSGDAPSPAAPTSAPQAAATPAGAPAAQAPAPQQPATSGAASSSPSPSPTSAAPASAP